MVKLDTDIVKMRYIYINTKEDRVVLIAREKVENHSDTEYMINDDFDLTKELDDMENVGKKLSKLLQW